MPVETWGSTCRCSVIDILHRAAVAEACVLCGHVNVLSSCRRPVQTLLELYSLSFNSAFLEGCPVITPHQVPAIDGKGCGATQGYIFLSLLLVTPNFYHVPISSD